VPVSSHQQRGMSSAKYWILLCCALPTVLTERLHGCQPAQQTTALLVLPARDTAALCCLLLQWPCRLKRTC